MTSSKKVVPSIATRDCPEGKSYFSRLREGLPEYGALLAGLCVTLRAHHFDCHESLVAFDPGVMTSRDRVRLTRAYSLLSTVVQAYGHAAGDYIPDMRKLASLGLDNRLHAFRPAPAWLEVEPTQRVTT